MGIDTLDDVQKKDLSRRYSMAYFGQFHYGVFYAYLKLKELEIANVVHLCELFSIPQMVGQKKAHPAWEKSVIPM